MRRFKEVGQTVLTLASGECPDENFVLVRLTVAARSVISKLRMCYRDNLYLFFFLDWECHEGTLEVFVNFCVVIDLINMAIEILPVLGIKENKLLVIVIPPYVFN
jgi:hypothetical protein